MVATDIQNRLREIRRACDLGPLTGKNLDQYWVDADAGRDPHRSVRDVICQKLEDKLDTRLLVYGHGGSGKSTELAKLVSGLDPKYFVVSFSVRQEMNFIDINGEDLILVMMERLVAAAAEKNLGVKETDLKAVQEYFARVTVQQQEARTSGLAVAAEAAAGTPLLFAPIVKLLASLKSEIKFESRSETTRVQTLRQRPADLLAQANLLVNAVRLALNPGGRVLFIVEDLDKLDIATARKVFIEKPTLLTGINADIIYTIPIFTFHSPDASILHTQFDHAVSLPMIKVSEPNGDDAEGFKLVEEIIKRRVGPDALAPSALELLVRKTGGVLQHAFEVIEIAALMKNASVPLAESHIRYGLQQKKNEFWTEITLPATPVPGLESKDQLFQRLEECANRQKQGFGSNPTGDPIDQVLLKACALVEYNGKRWFGVHPLVREILEDLGRLKSA